MRAIAGAITLVAAAILISAGTAIDTWGGFHSDSGKSLILPGVVVGVVGLAQLAWAEKPKP